MSTSPFSYPTGCEMPLLSRESGSRMDRSPSRGLLSISSPPPLLATAADLHLNPPSGGSDGGRYISQSEADADYQLFLDHLRLDDKSYVLEIDVGGSGPPLCVKYEEDEPGCLAAESSSKGTGKAKRGRKRKELVPHPNEGFDLSTPLHLSGLDIGGSLVDADYLLFLNNVEVRGGSMILEWRNNVTIVYEECERNQDTQQQEEVEVLTTEVELMEDAIGIEGGENGACLELHESEEHSYLAEILQHEPSSFRSRLMRVLKKPFDQKEYENMMSHFKLRTPIVKYKHLRDDSIAYPTQRLGNSYLDHFPDLAKRIESAFDDYHRGMLLRGFFFWLKNLSYTEAFKPWVPALPDSCYVTINSSNGKKLLVLQIDE